MHFEKRVFSFFPQIYPVYILRIKCRDVHGIASVSRIDQSIGLFGKRALQKRLYSAKETYHSIDPTHRSHPIVYMHE